MIQYNLKVIHKEGFWDEYNKPMPFCGEWKREEFIDKLYKVQRDRYIDVNSYRGFSICRVCDRGNGSEEFVLEDKNTIYIWPSGYLHYIKNHKIKPTNKFIEFVMNYTVIFPIKTKSLKGKE